MGGGKDWGRKIKKEGIRMGDGGRNVHLRMVGERKDWGRKIQKKGTRKGDGEVWRFDDSLWREQNKEFKTEVLFSPQLNIKSKCELQTVWSGPN